MKSVLVVGPDGRSISLDFECSSSSSSLQLQQLQEKFFDVEGIPPSEQLIRVRRNTAASCGSVCSNEKTVDLDSISHIEIGLRVVGGKGGFGSLLRGGNQGVKQVVTTNFGACRDLDGRRLRHTSNERDLREWENQNREEERRNQRQQQEEEIIVTKQEVAAIETVNKYLSEKDLVVDSISASIKDIATKKKGGKEEKRFGKEEGESIEGEKKKKEKKKKEEESFDFGEYGLNFDDSDDDDDDDDGDIDENEKEEEKLSQTPEKETEETEEKRTKKDGEVDRKVAVVDPPVLPVASQEEKTAPVGIDLSQYETVEDLHALGGDVLKEELRKRNMKIGGTVQERAQRLFQTKFGTPASTPCSQNRKRKRGGGTPKNSLEAPAKRPLVAI
eukprot:CAMPEP_0201480050 /NCGR_PEP_ID=MMETSP0151_2-20130828/4634_1 /ASSEMBLY_ACC=CAM_ASM_000257 /TAXON_ID=200890 /ORGANISM="Paramoeba atlantica, Strain 621/1 / CCAP 1560/9" /LENGTH=387 /DNA_ID=CAMNT_0047861799 /DNA_START=43 /DNA_END=1206 /DNA_ORIENTATION=+